MINELPEERFAKRPLVRRFSFWASIFLAVVAVSGFTLKDALFQNSATNDADTDSRTVTASWGPDREVFTIQSPAPYVVLNSIRDNPNYGDERNFALVKDASVVTSGGWADTAHLAPGDQVRVRAYIENSAGDNFGDQSVGWAQDVRVHVSYDSDLAYTNSVSVRITSSNAQTIWDGASVSSEDLIRLVYVPGSAELTTNAVPGGLQLSDNVVGGDGAIIGYDTLNGVIRPGYKYSAIVTMTFSIIGA